MSHTIFQMKIDELAHLQGFISKSNFRLNRDIFVEVKLERYTLIQMNFNVAFIQTSY